MFFVGIFITLIVWSFDGHLLFLLATLQFIGCPGICKNMSGLVSDTDVYFYQEKCVVLIKNLYVCVCACVSVCPSVSKYKCACMFVPVSERVSVWKMNSVCR